MKHDDEIHDLLRSVETPHPPAELRARVVQAASQTPAASVRPDVWTRLWQSRRLRVAWATSLVALLAGHLLVTLNHRAVTVAAQAPPTQAVTAQDPELRAVAALPRIDLDAASVEVGGRPSTAPENHEPATPAKHRGKENPT